MRLFLVGALSLVLAGCGTATAVEPRDQIKVAGSSTVFPFAKAVAERFQPNNGGRPAPEVQATGTGAGIERFCSGIGGEAPDVVGASRRMRPDEYRVCMRNGINEVVELQIGIDGLAFAHSPSARPIALTRRQIYEALAANPYGQPQTKRTWNEIDPALPGLPITVYGPPAGDGTRDSLVELIMLPACEVNPEMRRLKAQDQARFNQICSTLRSDGAYQETDENDERTSMQLVVNPRAIGIFGYSYLEKQGERLTAIPIDGVAPDAATIGAGRYLASRPLFLYIKKSQIGAIPGLREYLAEFMRATGPGTYLAELGLVPAADQVRQRSVQTAGAMTPLRPASLK